MSEQDGLEKFQRVSQPSDQQGLVCFCSSVPYLDFSKPKLPPQSRYLQSKIRAKAQSSKTLAKPQLPIQCNYLLCPRVAAFSPWGLFLLNQHRSELQERKERCHSPVYLLVSKSESSYCERKSTMYWLLDIFLITSSFRICTSFFARNCLRDGVFNRVIYSFIRSVTSGDVIYEYVRPVNPHVYYTFFPWSEAMLWDILMIKTHSVCLKVVILAEAWWAAKHIQIQSVHSSENSPSWWEKVNVPKLPPGGSLGHWDTVPYWGHRVGCCCWQIRHSAIELKRIYICVSIPDTNPFDKDKSLIIPLYWFLDIFTVKGHASGWESLLLLLLLLLNKFSIFTS